VGARAGLVAVAVLRRDIKRGDLGWAAPGDAGEVEVGWDAVASSGVGRANDESAVRDDVGRANADAAVALRVYGRDQRTLMPWAMGASAEGRPGGR
jgi:hypothetical protein